MAKLQDGSTLIQVRSKRVPGGREWSVVRRVEGRNVVDSGTLESAVKSSEMLEALESAMPRLAGVLRAASEPGA